MSLRKPARKPEIQKKPQSKSHAFFTTPFRFSSKRKNFLSSFLPPCKSTWHLSALEMCSCWRTSRGPEAGVPSSLQTAPVAPAAEKFQGHGQDRSKSRLQNKCWSHGEFALPFFLFPSASNLQLMMVLVGVLHVGPAPDMACVP